MDNLIHRIRKAFRQPELIPRKFISLCRRYMKRRVFINFFISLLLFFRPRNIVKIIIKISKKYLPPFITRNKLTRYLYRFIKSSFPNKQEKRVRNYIKHDISIDLFFSILYERNIQYVVLRWFEDLPDVAPDEDIDILMDDNDIERIQDLFTNTVSNKKIDLYSITKLYSYHGLSYYPPKIAREIIEHRVLFKEKYYVPSPMHYFLSLTYHALYHKGEKSGLSSKYISDIEIKPEHQYEEILRKMSADLNLGVEINLDSLHSYMQSISWSPQLDLLRKLSVVNKSKWQETILPPKNKNFLVDGEMIVFIVREWASSKEKMECILNIIKEKRIDIVKIFDIPEKQKPIVMEYVRGGEWGKGPYPICGGEPSCCIVAFDYHPVALDIKHSTEYPFVQNQNIFIKHNIRDYFNNEMLRTKWTNCIHSSDDEIEAWEYIKYICPDDYSELKEQIQLRRDLYKTKYKVLKLLPGNRTRSKVELIEYNTEGGIAVKKTYKYGNKRFLDREVFVYSILSKKYKFIPPLLEVSDSYLIIPYYKCAWNKEGIDERNEIIKKYEIQIVKVMCLFYQEGYALIDFTPNNVIITENKELKIIDYEFLYKYEIKPATFLESYDVKGIPEDFSGDLPLTINPPGENYNKRWKLIFKKNLANILEDPKFIEEMQKDG